MAKILVVDDEENIRLAFKEALEVDGHEVRTTGDASDAMRLLMDHDFDVVVTDIIMPGFSGTDLLSFIRRQCRDVQVIIITGQPSLDTAIQAVRSDAFDYLVKPVSGKQLCEAVSNAAGKKAKLSGKMK